MSTPYPEPTTPDLLERAERAVLSRSAGATDCTCEELQENLMEFLDSELSEDACTRYRAHAAQCSSCNELADAEQHIRDMVRRSCAEVAPSSLRRRVASQLDVLRANGIRAVD
ncbi:MAG: mycothiol system anti-sigma-R factor [Georgenia sp.]